MAFKISKAESGSKVLICRCQYTNKIRINNIKFEATTLTVLICKLNFYFIK